MAISNAQPIQFWQVNDETFNEKEVCGIESFCFCQKFELNDTIWIFAADEMFGTGTSSVDFFSVAFYDVNGNLILDQGFGSGGYTFFVPADNGFMDGQYSAIIHNNTTGSGTLYKSDCLDIRAVQECTNIIKYSNNKDFAGIPYENVSPGPELFIRLSSIFFREEFPQEEEVHPRSDDTWMRLSSRLEKKRHFELDFMPDYMHEKLLLVLMHDNIEIDGLMWTKRDPYNKPDVNRHYPMRKANVLLTDKNYIKRNLI